MFLDTQTMMSLVVACVLGTLFFVFNFALGQEVAMLLRDKAKVASTKAELIGAIDSVITGSAVFGIMMLGNLFLSVAGKESVSLLFLLFVSGGTSLVWFFMRRPIYQFGVRVFQSPSKLDDVFLVLFILLRSMGLGVLFYYLVSFLLRLWQASF
jgi:hypothetical protein